jgi:rRNA maturation endonuclease Nob1
MNERCNHLGFVGDGKQSNSSLIDTPIDKNKDGFAIWGCCGGCYTLTHIKFCPFCGENIWDDGVELDRLKKIREMMK